MTDTTQVYRVLIKASAQQIWDAIAQPAFTSRYFHGARVETTGVPGTPLRYLAPDGDTVWGDELIIESDPPYKLVVPWRSRRSSLRSERRQSPDHICSLAALAHGMTTNWPLNRPVG